MATNARQGKQAILFHRERASAALAHIASGNFERRSRPLAQLQSGHPMPVGVSGIS